MKPRVPTHTTFALIVCCLLGVFGGLGTYTFVYAKGFSYLSTAPESCANCHVMNRQYDGWLKSSHRGAAVCADCHVPHSFFPKYYIKAENGFFHSLKFTLQNYPDHIQIRESSRRVLNRNCFYCHADMAGHIGGNRDVEEDSRFCTRCHGGVGH